MIEDKVFERIEYLCQGFNITLSEFFDFELHPLRNDQLDQDEDELISKYRNLSQKKKALLVAYIDGLSQQ